MAAVIETDYLVLGTGACAMAFVDTLLTESPHAQVVMVDRHHRPGGHWNDAYPFVRLHQPTEWYGVESRELGDGSRENSGINAGLTSLASGAQVMAHFDQVMTQRFLPSGRVRWFPKTEHIEKDGHTHKFRSLLTGAVQTVRVRRKFVNVTHARTETPSTRPPRYKVLPGVQCIPLNALPKVERPYRNYTVVGAGKTGMDACIWLLENGVPHDRIRWIVPRDPWMLDRANLQPGPQGWRRYFGASVAQLDAIAQARDIPDLFRRLEESGVLMRLDTNVTPTTYRCAVVSRGELAQLQKVGEIVRLGRVRAIEPSRVVLEQGDVPADTDTLYIDCSASAIQPLPKVPIFEADTINILMVRTCQPLFSASVIGWVESHVPDVGEQNALCTPVRGPELPIDFLRMWAPTLMNTMRWQQNAQLRAWLGQSRLNAQAVVLKGVEITPEVQDFLKLAGAAIGAAGTRLPQLLAMSQAA